MKSNEIEEGRKLILDYPKLGGLVPVIAQDAITGQVLMLAYADRDAVNMTIQTGFATFWSRSRRKLWTKGEESGNRLLVKEILTDCDQDSLIYLVEMEEEGACRTRHEDGNPRTSCFYRRLDGRSDLTFLDRSRLDRQSSGIGEVTEREYEQIKYRYENPKEGSDATKTFQRKEGVERKLMEEAWEVTRASIGYGPLDRKVSELADLTYRMMQYMVQNQVTPQMLAAEMRRRQK